MRAYPKSPIIIGILGTRGSGKSSIADYIVCNFGARKYSFAAPVKKLAQKLYDFTDQQLYGDWRIKEKVDERVGISPRTAFQRIGDGARDVLNLNVWVDKCMRDIQNDYYLDVIEKNAPYIYIIDDVRRLNEVAAIRKQESWGPRQWKQGWILKLTPEDVQFDDEYAKHASESEVKEVPYDKIDYAMKVRHCDHDYEKMYSQTKDFISMIFNDMKMDGEFL